MNTHASTRGVSHAPQYRNATTCLVSALTELHCWSRLTGRQTEPTVADMLALFAQLQREYGEDAVLEDVIQLLIVRDGEEQYASRHPRQGRYS